MIIEWEWVLLGLLVLLLLLVVTRRKRRRTRRKQKFSSKYFQGLNYLLNDEQDKALDIFLHLVEVDWDTIDTSLALASIFRRKGEIDKSIKLHQSLLARPSLPPDYKPRVLLELGRDYLLAGWLDRAEGLFREILNDKAYAVDALQNLQHIYQTEQDWQQAFQTAWKQQKLSDKNIKPVIAHYYCELSEKASASGDMKEAEVLANQALSSDPNSVRASMLLGDIAMQRGRYQKAIRFYQQLEFQDLTFIPMVLDKLVRCYRNMSNLPVLIVYLKQLQNREPRGQYQGLIGELIQEVDGKEAAIEYLTEQMNQHPSLDMVDAFLKISRPGSDCIDQAIPTVIHQLVESQTSYQCEKCGFSANTHYWLCPGCHSWASIKPRILQA